MTNPTGDALNAAAKKQFSVSHGSAHLEEAQAAADELEEAMGEVLNGQRKPGKLPVEPMVTLIQFARDAALASQAEPPTMDEWLSEHAAIPVGRIAVEQGSVVAAVVAGLVREAWKAGAASGASQAEPAAVPLSDERIDHIADITVRGMPDGILGFCKSWGYRQFARALLEDCAGHYRAAPTPPAGEAPADGLPDRIWLQAYGDSSPDDGPPPDETTGDVSWCWHKVHEHDVEYRRVAAGEGAEAGILPAAVPTIDADRK